MRLSLAIFLCFLAYAFCESTYVLGGQGLSCNQVCHEAGKNCNPRVITNGNTGIFEYLGIRCGEAYPDWYSEDQPSYVSDPSHSMHGNCLGYKGAPDAIQCSAFNASVSRVCRCDDPADSPSIFGTGYSNGFIPNKEEKWIYQHYVAPGDVGVITHLWVTYFSLADRGIAIRYYIDGEKEASIKFTPSLACGVGFYDQKGPWGNEWFGKGAADSSWYNNFRIPFQKSIVVTVQHELQDWPRFHLLIRGSTNVPIVIGGRELPSTAKLNLNTINSTYQVLDWVPLVNESSGAGAFFQLTVAAESQNNKFLEGCLHAYFDGKNEFPGLIVGTGMEDYLDSAWFFNAGLYHLPTSGLTHLVQNDTLTTFSGYRFHNEDAMTWKNGFQLVWRIGDMDDSAGMKCHTISGGTIHNDPTETTVTAYAWYYTWPTTAETASFSTSLRSSSANLLSLFIAKIAVLISVCLYLL